ncbi:MAG: endonuclease/exonuclease/phosphatase family protein, partial [Phycisphaerales bacterium]
MQPAREICLLAWNILHGGGPERTPRIGLAIVEQAPDVVVLCEFRPGRGGQVRAQLADAGLVHQAASKVAPGKNGMLIASRFELFPVAVPGFEEFPGRLLATSVLGFTLVSVHVPDDGSLAKKAAFFQQLTALAKQNCEKSCVILGDFNTSRRGPDTDTRTFRLEKQLGLLETYGFVDAWRAKNPGKREHSWVSAAGQGRLDGAYLSAPLADALVDAKYDHAPRTSGLSDHSILHVRLKHVCETPPRAAPNGLFGPGETRD